MKKLIVSDASTLILLQKIALIDELIRNFKFTIPKEVYEEAVVKGKLSNSNDAYKLDEKVRDKVITVKDVDDREKVRKIIEEFNMGKGESEAIALFMQEKADIIAVDDHKAINVCKIYGIPFITALAFVLDSLESKFIKKKEAKDMIKKLSMHGRYKYEIICNALSFVEGENG